MVRTFFRHALAQGQTDRQIAETLEISVRTVEKHVERLLAKLDVERRTAAAAWLFEQRRQAGP